MPRDYDSFIPLHGQRALIAGQTGSGKTAFATWLLVRIPTTPIVIYDTKIEPKFDRLPASKVVVTIPEMLEAHKDTTIDYIIVRPPELILGEPRQLDDYLWQHYLHMHDTVAYIDEGGEFHSRGGVPFKGLVALMARGRSKGITTILSTQRPVSIARNIISEATKAYIFLMQDKRDRMVLDNIIPGFSRLPLPARHAFYYWEQGMPTATLFRPVKLDQAFNLGYTDATLSGTTVDSSNGEASPTTDTTEAPTKHVWV